MFHHLTQRFVRKCQWVYVKSNEYLKYYLIKGDVGVQSISIFGLHPVT